MVVIRKATFTFIPCYFYLSKEVKSVLLLLPEYFLTQVFVLLLEYGKWVLLPSLVRTLLVIRLWVFLMTSSLTHTHGSSTLCKDGVIQSNVHLMRSLKKTCIHKTKLIHMHSYLVLKLQVANGNADTCCGKIKCISKHCIKMESAELTHTHTHLNTMHYNKAADPLSL